MDKTRVANDRARSAHIAEILLASTVRAQLFRWAQACIANPEDADDVVAILVEKVSRTYGEAEVIREHVLAVAHSAAKTISLDEIRKRRAEKRGGSVQRVPFIEEAVGGYLQQCSGLEAEWVESILRRLPADLQPIARLHIFEGVEITSAIRTVAGEIDERTLATTRARWYHHVRKLDPLVRMK